MKIKFTLQRPAGAADLVATVDSSTTIGALAGYLAAADPSTAGHPRTDADALTLGLVTNVQLAMDPRQTVVESGLRSGGTVAISRSGSTYADPHRSAAAVVRVLDGPDRGREYQIPHGTSVVGRERDCDVRLTDAMVSRRHARINITDVVEIVDLGSANGILIDDLAVPRSVLRAADAVQVGDTRLSVRLLQPTAAERAEAGPAVGFVRSPRLDPVYQGVAMDAPEPPERPRQQRFPLIPLVAPLVMGLVLYLVTRSATALIFIGLSPVLMIGNALESRLAGRSAYRHAVKDFREDVQSLVEDADKGRQYEAIARQQEHPDTPTCLAAVRSGSPLLWSRRPADHGFVELRLGAGRLPARNTIELPSVRRAARGLYKELIEAVQPFATVDDVPVVASLGESALGIGGPRSKALPIARAVVAQLLALHSPAELVLTALASSQSARDWEWLKWAPHSTSPHSPLATRHLASTAAGGTVLVSELEELLSQRRGTGSDSASAVPAVVLLVEDDTSVERSRLVALAEQGTGYGIHVIWLAAEVSLLPAACRTFVEIDRTGSTGSVGYVHTAIAVTPIRLEEMGEQDATDLAHRLAPIVDVGARVDDASDLPRAVSLLGINGTELASSSQAVIERWTENRSILSGPFAPPTPPKHAGTLRAVIGQSASEVHALDLRTDGPHALVGGTTGAGKSELLQAWILAMAAAHSPQRLTFLLVDYKGGSAFRDCVELPHTVGLVTDLSPHLVRRALTSLSAELKYREHVLAKHAAKDLVTLEKQGVLDAPPSLVIVVDEFAALVNEVPEFVDGVVNVAQRGRSLGLHLILATQRPAGVIKDNLRANTNLRLALRMADEADSSDVLGSPQAAFFDPALPGRAVSKTGPGRLVPFQTGYAGGWTTDEPPPPEILVEELAFGSGAVWEPPEAEDPILVDPGPTDIRRLVASVVDAHSVAQIPLPRKPWLPELKTVYDLSDQAQVPSRRRDTELVFGVCDDPDNQSQPTMAFLPDHDGNFAVYGTGGSGKSTLLRTIAIAAGFTVRGGPCHVYGIDFGARGLSMLEELPHVGSIVSGSDHERITRLLAWLRGLIDERALRYSRVNAGTVTDYRRIEKAPDEPRIVLLVDGIGAFRQAYEVGDRAKWFDTFVSIAADGRPVGVNVALSADRPAAVPSALASAVQRRLVLRMADANDYLMMGVAGDVLNAASPPGRGLLGDRELQVALLGTQPDVGSQALRIRRFADSMLRAGAAVAPPIRQLPEKVPLADLPASVEGRVIVGVSSESLSAVGVEARGSFIVSGPPGSGRSTALRLLAVSLLRANPGARLLYFGNRRSPLASLPIWTARSLGTEEVAQRAAELANELPLVPDSAPAISVFIENIAEFIGGPAENPLQALAKVCIAEDRFLVIEGETSTLTSNFGLLAQAKSSRAGIALQPDTSDGPSVYRTNFPPRLNRADFPPGRGLLVGGGKATVVQIAMPGDG
jgi:S-DNA-T family DNA segregation ATPase FtsK/SpoIIIE